MTTVADGGGFFSGNFVEEMIFGELVPTLDMPQEEVKMYGQTVIERFQNPFLKHQLIDISLILS